MEDIKQKIIEFVKYHNAFTIVLILALVGAGAVFANEDVRDAVIGEEVVIETKGLDNSVILAADLEVFDAMMQIIGVTEDAENYFVEYAYQTLAIQDNSWAEFTRQEVLDVSKAALADRDLGLYLIEELGEIVENELALLKEVQEEELAKGKTEIVETIDYTGLIGLVLDAKNKILPGYEPKVFGCMDSTANNYNPDATQDDESCDYSILGCTDTNAKNYNSMAEKNDDSCEYEQLPPVIEPIFGCMDSTATNYNPSATENNGSCVYPPLPVSTPSVPLAHPPALTSPTPPTPIYGCMDSTAMNYNPDATEDNGSCVYPAPPVDEPEDVCDADHLDLCNTQELCQGISLYWYDDACNTSAEEPPAPICDLEHLNLCLTESDCSGVSGFWYGDACNPEPQNILGCTDETATNYNAEATEDDGSCEYPAPTCDSFTYSDYGECQADGTQTRTVLTSLPDGCEDGEPVLSQGCDYDLDPDPDPDPEE
jgi:hypothetical protein